MPKAEPDLLEQAGFSLASMWLMLHCHVDRLVRVRVHELAWEVGAPWVSVRDELARHGHFVSSHMSSVPPPLIRTVKEAFPESLERSRRQPRSSTQAEMSPPTWWQGPLKRPRRPPGPRRTTLYQPQDEDDWLEDPLSDQDELTTADVARLLRVAPSTVRKWVQRRHLVPVRSLAGSHVFKASEVQLARDAIADRNRSFVGNRHLNIRPKHYDRLIGLEMAARLAGVRPSTVRSWIHRGRLQPIQSPTPLLLVRVGDLVHMASGTKRNKTRRN